MPTRELSGCSSCLPCLCILAYLAQCCKWTGHVLIFLEFYAVRRHVAPTRCLSPFQRQEDDPSTPARRCSPPDTHMSGLRCVRHALIMIGGTGRLRTVGNGGREKDEKRGGGGARQEGKADRKTSCTICHKKLQTLQRC